MYFSYPVPMEVLLLPSWQVPSLPCLLALWSGVLAVTSFLSISFCPVLTLLLMFCACSDLQLFCGLIWVFDINHVPLEVFNVNRQAWVKYGFGTSLRLGAKQPPGLPPCSEAGGLCMVLGRDAVRRWVGWRHQLLLLNIVRGTHRGGPE